MALGFLNRVGFRASSSGTGSFVVASALTGMQTPAQAAGPAVVNANTYRYFAESDDKTQWEYGYGVYTTGDVTLTRATVLDNSSGGTTALSFSAAPKVFMGGPLAQDMGWRLLGSFIISSPTETPTVSFDAADCPIVRFEASGVEGNTAEIYQIALGDGVDTANIVSDSLGFTMDADARLKIITEEISLLVSTFHCGGGTLINTDNPAQGVNFGSNGSTLGGGGEIDRAIFSLVDGVAAAVEMTAGTFRVWGLPYVT